MIATQQTATMGKKREPAGQIRIDLTYLFLLFLFFTFSVNGKIKKCWPARGRTPAHVALNLGHIDYENDRAHTSHRPSLSTRKKIFFNRGGREAEEEKAQKRRIFSFHGLIFTFISFKKKQRRIPERALNSLSPSSPELDSPSRLYEHPLYLNA